MVLVMAPSSNTVFKRDEVVLLLGAGASVPAHIPASQGMIKEIEKLLESSWADYKRLYFFVKSAIQFSDGIHGRFDTDTFNVEKLVETLDDLRRGDEHPLYPFVGAWVPKLYEVAGSDLQKVTAFREEIVRRLRDDWIQLEYKEHAQYFAHLTRFQRELQEPLRLFTLNYDLCVETALSDVSESPSITFERGFDEQKKWDWRRFEYERGDGPPDIYLYKLHGSIDWTRDENDNLTYRDAVSQINPEDLAIIFGTPAKLQAVDPFLFFAYELRKWTLEEARLIVTIGYGFADDHINGILRQSLKGNHTRKLLAVTFIKDDESAMDMTRKRQNEIARKIGIFKEDEDDRQQPNTQIIVWGCGAKEFLEKKLTVEDLGKLFPAEDTLFDEVTFNRDPKNLPTVDQPNFPNDD
jgi:SIR2-like domain